jgi:glycosyltransferase involved in cell wall biosynthesis
MTTLRAIAEDALARHSRRARFGGLARYAGELTRALVETAPPGCEVELVFAKHDKDELAEAVARFPGAGRVETASLSRAPLAAAWAAGVRVSVGPGILHAPSLLAPLVSHDRSPAAQVVVTIHDTVAWTHPSSIGLAEAQWTRRMAHRAAKNADAIVVPTHAVAEQLRELLPVGDRVRVIPGAVSSGLVLPEDPEVRASWLQLPDEPFVLASGSMDPRTGIDALIEAAALPEFGGLPLLIVGDDDWRGRRITETAMLAGLPEGRVRPLGSVTDADLALLLSRAAVFVAPGLTEGFGLSALEALTFGTPLVHSDAPALVEVADDAGVTVARDEAGSSYAERLAAAIGGLLGDQDRIETLRVLGLDRAKAFSWRSSGEQVWQLHAEL